MCKYCADTSLHTWPYLTYGEKLAPKSSKTRALICSSSRSLSIPITIAAMYIPSTANNMSVVIEHNLMTGQHVILSMSQ